MAQVYRKVWALQDASLFNDAVMRPLAGAVLALNSLAAHGGEFRFQCPERYPSRLIELRDAALPSWDAVSTIAPELPVSGGGMISGPPSNHPRGELRGRETMLKNGGSVTEFPVDPNESWIYCAYGKGGEIQLFRRVDPTGARTCTLKILRPKWPASTEVTVSCT